MSADEARNDDRVALAMVIREAFLGVPGYEPDDEDYAIADAILGAGYVKYPEPEWEYATARPAWPNTPVHRYRTREAAVEAVRNPPIGSAHGAWIAIARQAFAPGPWAPVEGETR